MTEAKKTIAIVLVLLGIAIGFLGELMPDSFKKSVAAFSTDILGISYMLFWSSCTIFVIGLTIFFVFRQSLDEQPNKLKGSSAKLKGVKDSEFSQLGQAHKIDAEEVENTKLIQDNTNNEKVINIKKKA